MEEIARAGDLASALVRLFDVASTSPTQMSDDAVAQILRHTMEPAPSNLWAVLCSLPTRPLDPPAPQSLGNIWQHFLRLRAALASLRSVEAAGLRTQLSPSLLASDPAVWTSFLPLCLWLQRHQRNANRRLLIGICGPPGAGKTVLSEILMFALNRLFAPVGTGGEDDTDVDVSCVFAFDAYHYPNAYLDSHFVERDGAEVPLRQFKGDPVSFDVSAFVRDLQRIKHQDGDGGGSGGGDNAGRKEIRLPVYDRRLHDPVPDALTIKSQHSFVLVEGLLLLHDELGFEAIRDHLDVCLFLDVDEPECHRRVVARKVVGGRDPDDAERHYARVDLPNVVRINQRSERADLLLQLGPDGEIRSARPGRLAP